MPTIFFTLYFDASLERAIRDLWDVIARCGIDRQVHRPHITLAAFEVEDPAALDARLTSFTEARARIPIELHHIGIFPERSVVFLAPHRSKLLLRLHRCLVQEFSSPGDPPVAYENLRIENWVPHCTLAVTPAERLGKVVRALQEGWSQLCGMAEGIGVLQPPSSEDRLQVGFRAPAVAP